MTNTHAHLRLRPADKAWLALWAWVFIYNSAAAIRHHHGSDCELLSEACDRYRSRYRWPLELWLAIFYLHLSRHVPNRLDPVNWIDVAIRRALGVK